MLLEKQVNLERIEDSAPLVLPIHYRRALHTLLVKPYRGDDKLYGYLKTLIQQLYPDKGAAPRADGHALRQWLQQHPAVDRTQLENISGRWHVTVRPLCFLLINHFHLRIY